jgi:hypothetical protein
MMRSAPMFADMMNLELDSKKRTEEQSWARSERMTTANLPACQHQRKALLLSG